MPERLLREMLENDATEAVMRDVLHEALVVLQKVNPFFADWGLPSLLRKLSPLASARWARRSTRWRAEFDRRLEPEMRSSCKAFSRRALRQFADFTIQRRPARVRRDPEAPGRVRPRRQVAEMTPDPKDRRAVGARDIALECGWHLLTRDRQARAPAHPRDALRRPRRQTLARRSLRTA